MNQLWKNNQWEVTEEGLSSLESPLDNGGYFIDLKQLNEPPTDWIIHLLDKIWVDPKEFVDALYEARRIHLGKIHPQTTQGLVPDNLATYIFDQFSKTANYRLRDQSSKGGAITGSEMIALVLEGRPDFLYSRILVDPEDAHILISHHSGVAAP